jgi:3-oxo-5-alpha-steroid 4-dehydrogenase 1
MEFLKNLDLQTYTTLIYFWGGLGIVSALSILFTGMLPISSRVYNQKLAWMGSVDKKIGWIIMETPILISVLYFYLSGSNSLNASAVMVAAFVFHYGYRALIYPHRIKVTGKTMPVSMVLMTMIFYTINGYLIGQYFGSLREYSPSWLLDRRFIVGLALFIFGFVINLKSDNILINLRAPGESGYKIPSGGLFRYVSCPNYFGEIVEWVGFALMTWSLPGTVYAIWVCLTLFATGIGTHKWYLLYFKETYPKNRKAVVPFLI